MGKPEKMYCAFARGERTTSAVDGPMGPVYMTTPVRLPHGSRELPPDVGPTIKIVQEIPGGTTISVELNLEQVSQTIAALEVWRALAEHGK